ncbi:MAG: hypothetical protein Q9218_001624 [Villophora microphyllina]
MEGAPSNQPGGSPDGNGVLDRAVDVASVDDTLNHEIVNDAQSMLVQVAQDASSQMDEDSTMPAVGQDEGSAAQAKQQPTITNGQSALLETAIDGQILQNGGHMGGSDSQTYNLDTLLPTYDHLQQPGLTNGSLDLAQVNEALVDSVDDPTLEAATSLVESEAPRIQAFAKLEFDDGEFYMNTYSVELGRDVYAARQAYERDLELIQQASAKLGKRSSSSDNLSRSSSKLKQENGERLAESVISESGGVMRVDPLDSQEPKQLKFNDSKSTTSSSQQLSRKSSMNLAGMRTDYQSLAMASLRDPTADQQLVASLNDLPSPDSCPLVPIHPPTSTDGALTSHKSISRKHVRITFNFQKHLFEVVVLGRNGAFVDEDWYAKGDVQPLRSGSLIQIGGVGIRFLLPDVALGETGAEDHLTSDPASLEINQTNGAYGDLEASSDIERDEDDEADDNDDDDSGDGSNGNESAASDQEEEESNDSEEEMRGRQRPRATKPTPANRPVRNRKQVRVKEPMKKKEPPKAKSTSKQPLQLTSKTKEAPKPDPVIPLPRRKGPGRPPKNGIISKREQALQARQAREAAKAAAQGNSHDMLPSGRGKGKSIPRPAEVKPEKEKNNLQPNGKRKYKKRKTKAELEAGEQTGEQQAVRESTEHTDAVPPEQNAAPPPKPLKPIKPPKPPRSPSPVFDESTLTPEQLAKPNNSYVVLIYEALSNSTAGQMSLPQIYRAIERRYPYYKIKVQTTGWQSSVRHNLSQHPAFRKIERDGKGWMWGLDPAVSIEKEKKRRTTPPPGPPQTYYSGPQYSQASYPPYPNLPGSIPYPFGPYPGLPVGQRPYAPPAHYAPPVPSTAPALPAALANAQVDNSPTYQSPYATGPPKSEPSQQQQNAPATNGQQHSSELSTTAEDKPTPQNPPQASSHQTTKPPTPSTTPSCLSQQQFLLPPHRPPSNSNHNHRLANHTPEVQNVIHKFKTFLLNSMADRPNAEAIIDNAIRGVLNDKNNHMDQSPAGSEVVDGNGQHKRGDDYGEKAIQNTLRGMLDNLRKKGEAGAAGNGSGGGGGAGTTFTELLKGVGEGARMAMPAATPARGAVQQKQQVTVEGNGVQEGVEDGDDGSHKAKEAERIDVIEEKTGDITMPRPMKSGKRPLEEDEGEGAMDGRQMGAKRVAT